MSQNMKTGENDPSDQDVLSAHLWRDEAGNLHIDVTALNAPDPFIAVLKLLEWPRIDESTVTFHNDIMPVHLFPELDERGFETDIMQNTDEGFVMRIYKSKAS